MSGFHNVSTWFSDIKIGIYLKDVSFKWLGNFKGEKCNSRKNWDRDKKDGS